MVAASPLLTSATPFITPTTSEPIVVTGAGANTIGQVYSGQALIPNVNLIGGAYPRGAITGTGIVSGTTIAAVSTVPIQATGNTTNNSTSLTLMTGSPPAAGIPPGVQIGMLVSAQDIPPGTTITGVTSPTVTLSKQATAMNSGEAITISGQYVLPTTGNLSSTSNTIMSVGSVSGVVPGMSISGRDIAPGTIITGVTTSPNQLFLSAPPTATVSSEAITINSNNWILMSNAAVAGSGAQTITYPGGPLVSKIVTASTFSLNTSGSIANGTTLVTGATTTQASGTGTSPPWSIAQGMAVTDMSHAISPGTTVVAFTSSTSGMGTIILSKQAIATATGDSITIAGYYAQLADSAVAAVPTFVATKVAKVVAAGSNYTTGMILSVGDGPGGAAGTMLQIMPDVSMASLIDSNANVSQQTSLNSLPYNALATSNASFAPAPQIGNTIPGGSGGMCVSPSGCNATFRLAYAPTGQIWYGTDDSFATNNALTSAVVNTNVSIPANRACGVANSINLPVGDNSLVGSDVVSSQLVALAAMPVDVNGVSYVVGRAANPVMAGGGMRDLYVEGNQLAGYTCAVEGGELQLYDNVECEDGVSSEWICGYTVNNVAPQINGTIFRHIRGKTNFNAFGPTTQMSQNNFLATNSCEGEQVVYSYFAAAVIPILDNQSDYNLYSGDAEDAIIPYNPLYCMEITGHQTVTANRCTNPTGAGIYVAGSQAIVDNFFVQWNNAVPTSATYGVLIASQATGDLVEGVNTDTYLASGTVGYTSSPANVVYQQGTAYPSTIVANNIGASYSAPVCSASSAPLPQGRLTLQFVSPNAVPVMTTYAVNKSTVYYAPYIGSCIPINTSSANPVPVLYQFTSSPTDTVGLTLQVNAGYNPASANYDLFVGFNTNSSYNPTMVLCLGPAWSVSNGSSATRGTGAGTTEIAPSNGLWTNRNTLACRFGTTSGQTFNCLPSLCTYVGTMYTTSNGKTSFNPQPAAISGGPSSPNAGVYIWNAYNRVPVTIVEQDSAPAFTCSAVGAWERADMVSTSQNNVINVVDGLQANPWNLSMTEGVAYSGDSPEIGASIDWISGASPTNPTQTSITSAVVVPYAMTALPLLGYHTASALEYAHPSGTTCTSAYFNASSSLSMQLVNWMY